MPEPENDRLHFCSSDPGVRALSNGFCVLSDGGGRGASRVATARLPPDTLPFLSLRAARSPVAFTGCPKLISCGKQDTLSSWGLGGDPGVQ